MNITDAYFVTPNRILDLIIFITVFILIVVVCYIWYRVNELIKQREVKKKNDRRKTKIKDPESIFGD